MVFQNLFTKWLICGVSLHMAFKTSIVGKNIKADIAYKHLHAFVNLAVGREINGCCKCLPTHLTNEWLPFIMIAPMDYKRENIEWDSF